MLNFTVVEIRGYKELGQMDAEYLCLDGNFKNFKAFQGAEIVSLIKSKRANFLNVGIKAEAGGIQIVGTNGVLSRYTHLTVSGQIETGKDGGIAPVILSRLENKETGKLGGYLVYFNREVHKMTVKQALELHKAKVFRGIRLKPTANARTTSSDGKVEVLRAINGNFIIKGLPSKKRVERVKINLRPLSSCSDVGVEFVSMLIQCNDLDAAKSIRMKLRELVARTVKQVKAVNSEINEESFAIQEYSNKMFATVLIKDIAEFAKHLKSNNVDCLVDESFVVALEAFESEVSEGAVMKAKLERGKSKYRVVGFGNKSEYTTEESFKICRVLAARIALVCSLFVSNGEVMERVW